MQLENSFLIQAPPDRVFAFLLDPHNVVGCVPGAELTEEVDPVTFKGKVKIKVGPITVAYSGIARVLDRNDAQRTATLEGEGRETTGPGSGRGKAVMSVTPEGNGSRVVVVTEFTLTGRVAQFGRGVIEDVSKRMVRDVADCIQTNLELAQSESETEPSGEPSAESSADTGEAPPPPRPMRATATAKEINAFALVFSITSEKVTDPGFWDGGIKLADRLVAELERLTARVDSLFAEPRRWSG